MVWGKKGEILKWFCVGEGKGDNNKEVRSANLEKSIIISSSRLFSEKGKEIKKQ